MKIPKYINDLLNKRTKCANDFLYFDHKISEWIEKNGIDVPLEDYGTGARSLFEPEDSAETIRQCILEKDRRLSNEKI